MSLSSSPVNKLDLIRRSQGINSCKTMFVNLAKESNQKAVLLVNDKNLSFTSLFILQPEMYEMNLIDKLSERNQIALKICDIISQEKYSNGDYDNSISLKSDKVHHTLLWIFNTGATDDGLNDEFEQILDSTASVLIKEHHKKAIIPVMTDMVFKRNRKGRNIHDLVWVCFQAKDSSALRYFAQGLHSPIAKDVELARTLLNLPQDTPLRNNFEKQKQYSDYLYWLNENNPYICFTGQSFNFSNSPVPFIVDWEAKYLCTGGVVQAIKQLDSTNDTEHKFLSDFNKLPENYKIILANYSQRLHNKNISNWNKWMQYSVDKQIQFAKDNGRDFT